MPTPIEWCDETFNPWWGCERVSPACAHCYADTFAKRLGMSDLWPRVSGFPGGSGHGFRFFGDKHWDEPLKWARTLPAKLGRRPRVFCASMADVFEDRLELEQPRRRLFRLIAETEELDWLLLTKRPEFARDWMRRWYDRYWSDVDVGRRPEPLPWTTRDGEHWGVHPNIWIGASIENARYTWRADVLREIPAAVRFISAEPLLGSLFDGRGALTRAPGANAAARAGSIGNDALESRPSKKPLDLTGIDWVIIGGESGPKSRPFHLEHAREIIARCDPYEPVCCGDQSRGECCNEPVPRGQVEPVPALFVKQLGAKPVETIALWHDANDRAARPLKLQDRKGGAIAEWPADLRIREFPQTAAVPA